jgi:hypothetical protein
VRKCRAVRVPQPVPPGYYFVIESTLPRAPHQTHKKDIMREHPDFAKQKFLYRLSRSEYEKEWGKEDHFRLRSAVEANVRSPVLSGDNICLCVPDRTATLNPGTAQFIANASDSEKRRAASPPTGTTSVPNQRPKKLMELAGAKYPHLLHSGIHPLAA